MRLPRAILFDHDGVLVESEPLHWAAWRTLLRETGLPEDLGPIQAQIGRPSYLILHALLDLYRPGWTAEHYDIQKLVDRKGELYLSSVPRLQAYPGVSELLDWMDSRSIRAAVVSNAREPELFSALRNLGLFERFAEVIPRDRMPAPKPDPSGYLMAAGFLGVEPGDCLVVEDSPPGLEAGLLAGIPCAAVATNFPVSALEQPVLGRPDLRPVWVGASILELAAKLRSLA